MPTYKQIQDRVRAQTGRTPQELLDRSRKSRRGSDDADRYKSHKREGAPISVPRSHATANSRCAPIKLGHCRCAPLLLEQSGC